MAGTRKLIIRAALLAIGGVIVAALALRDSRDLELTRKARRVLDTSDWKYSGPLSYDWLSVDELLLYRTQVRKGMRFSVPVKHDLKTNAESELGVGRLFASYKAYGIPYRAKLSPDKQSLIWWGNRGQTYIGTLDGSAFRGWKGWEHETHWVDNRRCVAIKTNNRGSQALIRSIDPGIPDITRPLPPFGQIRHSFINPNGNFETIAVHYGTPGGVTLQIDEHPLVGIRAALRSRSIFLNDADGLIEICHSSSGDRLAVVVMLTSVSFIDRLIGSFIPRSPASRIEVRVVNLDGSGEKTLGTLPAPPGYTPISSVIYTTDEYPLALRWLPGERRVSFVYKKALWTLPVN